MFGDKGSSERIWFSAPIYAAKGDYVGARLMGEVSGEYKGVISKNGFEVRAAGDARVAVNYLNYTSDPGALGTFSVDVSSAASANADIGLSINKGGPLGVNGKVNTTFGAEVAAIKGSVIYKSKSINLLDLVEIRNTTQADGHLFGIGASATFGAGTLKTEPGFTFYGGAGVTLGVGGKVKTSFDVTFPWMKQ